MLAEGRQTFRFDTFGDEEFWGGTLKLHQAIEARASAASGRRQPPTALAVGLKVDVERSRTSSRVNGQVNLDDPATTLALLELERGRRRHRILRRRDR